MTVEYLDLADYVAIAAAVTGLDEDTVVKIADLGLADSALHAPGAGFGDHEFYEDFVNKAAVLVVRLARNHPLPDGNKRAAWVAFENVRRDQRLVMATPTRPRRNRSGRSVDRVGRDEDQTADWLRTYLVAPASA